MSSGTASPPREDRPASPPPCEALIDDRLLRTRRRVKGVDVATGLTTLAIGTLAYLLAAAVVDHWVLTGGLGFWGRLALLAGLLAGGGRYFARNVLPSLVHRINPVYAAHTIEESSPSLKNSLVNLLLLRGQRDWVSQPVYQALQNRAAADLSDIDAEAAVDHARLIRLGYLLVGTVAVCCLYLVISPKSAVSSAARVLWPWSTIAAPTRVTFENVTPGDAAVFHGDFVTVSAEVRGLRPDEPVALFYSTADGQCVDQKIPLAPPENGFAHQFQCRLPVEERGLQQDVTYFLSAGDSTTRTFSVVVQTAPTIVVDRVEYDYPDYTGFANQIVSREGDLRAIEGTEVILRGTANRNVASAKIDLGCTGFRELDMKPSGDTASGRFLLRLRPSDPSLPEFDCYQLRFRDDSGQLNPRPTRHRIEVIRDLPPEIELVSPVEEEVSVVETGRLEIRVRAQDPDFALRRVVLRAECDGRKLAISPLLNTIEPGEFEATYWFEPAKVAFEDDSFDATEQRLKAGDRVRYWAEAEDNKRPTAGTTSTAQQWINIVAPAGRQPGSETADGTGEGASRPAQGSEKGTGQEEQPPNEGSRGASEPPQPGDEPPNEGGEQGENGPEEGQGDQRQPEGSEPSGEGEPEAGQEEGAGENGTAGSESGEGAQGGQKPTGGQEGGADQPIDPDTQPGDAIEEILKHQQEQQREGAGSSEGGQSGDEPGGDPSRQQPNSEAGGGQSGNDSSNAGQPGSRQPDSGNLDSGNLDSGNLDSGNLDSGNLDSGQPDPGQSPDGNSPDGQRPENPPGDGQGESASQGDGPSDRDQGGGEPESNDGQANDSPPEDASDTESEGAAEQPGAGGDQAGNGARRPDPQGADQPPGSEAGGARNGAAEQPPDSPNGGRGQSDTQGETSGGRSGQGEAGGGQQSQRSGTGAAGSQTEAPEGGSAGDQQGDGPTGSGGGDRTESDRPTGNSGEGAGNGGSDREGEPGEVGDGAGEDGNQGSADNAVAADGPNDGGQPSEGSSAGSGAPNRGVPGPGGGNGERSSGSSSPEAENPGGDAPNLEYSRRATDLALEHLRDQMNQEDSDLLDRLGWTREDAEKFVARWEQMKRAAAQEGEQGDVARQELDRAIESLGLAPRGTQLEGGETGSDPLPGLREAGRFEPPSDWSELFRAYTRGIAGGDQ